MTGELTVEGLKVNLFFNENVGLYVQTLSFCFDF